MRTFLLFIFAILAIGFESYSQESKSTNSSKQVVLEIHRTRIPSQSGPHRAPFFLDINVYYDSETNCLEISSDGELDCEVFLYRNDELLGYDSKINTSFQISELSGQYKIVITGEYWEAYGSFDF